MVRIAWFENGLVTGRPALAGGYAGLADRSSTRFSREIPVSEQPEEVLRRNSHKTSLIRVSFGRLNESSPEASGAGPGEPNSWLIRKWIPAPFAFRPAVSQPRGAQLTLREGRVRTSLGEWALDDRTSAPTPSATFRTRQHGCPNDGNELSGRRELRGRASRRRDPSIPGFEILATVGAQKEGTDR
jgi:hypothetical protein